jgi:hypothetical protein
MPKTYPTGCDLSQVPNATDGPPTDVDALLSVDSSNPFLRELRIQQGLLKLEQLPEGLREEIQLDRSEAKEEGQ